MRRQQILRALAYLSTAGVAAVLALTTPGQHATAAAPVPRPVYAPTGGAADPGVVRDGQRLLRVHDRRTRPRRARRQSSRPMVAGPDALSRLGRLGVGQGRGLGTGRGTHLGRLGAVLRGAGNGFRRPALHRRRGRRAPGRPVRARRHAIDLPDPRRRGPGRGPARPDVGGHRPVAVPGRGRSALPAYKTQKTPGTCGCSRCPPTACTAGARSATNSYGTSTASRTRSWCSATTSTSCSPRQTGTTSAGTRRSGGARRTCGRSPTRTEHVLMDQASTGLCGPGGADVVSGPGGPSRIFLHAWVCSPTNDPCEFTGVVTDPQRRRVVYAAYWPGAMTVPARPYRRSCHRSGERDVRIPGESTFRPAHRGCSGDAGCVRRRLRSGGRRRQYEHRHRPVHPRHRLRGRHPGGGGALDPTRSGPHRTGVRHDRAGAGTGPMAGRGAPSPGSTTRWPPARYSPGPRTPGRCMWTLPGCGRVTTTTTGSTRRASALRWGAPVPRPCLRSVSTPDSRCSVARTSPSRAAASSTSTRSPTSPRATRWTSWCSSATTSTSSAAPGTFRPGSACHWRTTGAGTGSTGRGTACVRCTPGCRCTPYRTTTNGGTGSSAATRGWVTPTGSGSATRCARTGRTCRYGAGRRVSTRRPGDSTCPCTGRCVGVRTWTCCWSTTGSTVTPGSTILGAAQLDWLLRAVAGSHATFTAVGSGVPVSWFPQFAGAADKWTGYDADRSALTDALAARLAQRTRRPFNPVVFSGDTHRGVVTHVRARQDAGERTRRNRVRRTADDQQQRHRLRPRRRHRRVPGAVRVRVRRFVACLARLFRTARSPASSWTTGYVLGNGMEQPDGTVRDVRSLAAGRRRTGRLGEPRLTSRRAPVRRAAGAGSCRVTGVGQGQCRYDRQPPDAGSSDGRRRARTTHRM